MFAWATPEYVLERMSMDQITLYYRVGLDFEGQRRIGAGQVHGTRQVETAKVTRETPKNENWFVDMFTNPETVTLHGGR